MSELLTRDERAAVSATFNAGIDTLPDAVGALLSINTLWEMCVDLALDGAAAHGHDVDRDIHATIRQPYVQIRKQSPLWVEVASALNDGLVVSSALGFFAWLLKNPGSIAGFLPAFKEHWHHGWHRAEAAERERLAYRFKVEQLAAQLEGAEPGDVDATETVPDFGKVNPDEFWSSE